MRWIALAFTLPVIACSSGTSAPSDCGAVLPCRADSACCGGICNTSSGICMMSCDAGCSATEQCSAGACVCTSDAACGGGSAYCNTFDGSCEAKCSDNGGCAGFPQSRVCNNGECLPP